MGKHWYVFSRNRRMIGMYDNKLAAMRRDRLQSQVEQKELNQAKRKKGKR
jgi:hypothetical protein